MHATAVDEGGLFAGRIDLREHLATGAEAEVFRAYRGKLRRPVALKRLLERLEGNPDDRVRFEGEAWVLAALVPPGAGGCGHILADAWPSLGRRRVALGLHLDRLAQALRDHRHVGEPLRRVWVQHGP